MPTDGPARPDPKEKPRGARRYRRTVASPKQWQAIIAAKVGPCRICGDPGTNGRMYGRIHFHHVVARGDSGADTADNIVPLCPGCHDQVTRRELLACAILCASLTDAEYSYAIEQGGEGYLERRYGIRYVR
ncbi:MAG TPA: HNH endonuclease signature motif containing protein [Solirubrobacteraceae bacterium]|jgi:predicted HNH restriction endonuclease|nr:HNH endonuclease signature motif containing protein [Solirubrobacteraceae bacterium]